MKKLLARLPVILIGIPAVYWLLVKADNYIKLLFFAVIAVLGQYELCSMLEKGKRKPILEWVSSIAILTGAFWGERIVFACLTGCVVLAMMFTVFRGLKGDGIRYFCHVVFSLFYLPFCLAYFYLLSLKIGGMALFLILASVWALDIGAYIFGMSIRGPKLAPNISPNKTIAGAVGGFICSVAFLYSASHFGWAALPMPQTIIAAIFIATIGQIADLFESVIKRESDTKDSSSLLGAHGGILDRIDSVLFLGPLCYFIYTL